MLEGGGRTGALSREEIRMVPLVENEELLQFRRGVNSPFRRRSQNEVAVGGGEVTADLEDMDARRIFERDAGCSVSGGERQRNGMPPNYDVRGESVEQLVIVRILKRTVTREEELRLVVRVEEDVARVGVLGDELSLGLATVKPTGERVDVNVRRAGAGGVPEDLDDECPVGWRPVKREACRSEIDVSVVEHGKREGLATRVEHGEDLAWIV